mmetsp:Transcript_19326/g.56171  ORF Transcript_19326/g.56171 Transcript_19326/m.56171 type:complete len:635 (+) Transcript_19326:374-2278(+)|eukprot:CAMPEP_0176005884 /NCGR_PEP_ID=MMETSP0120_2-20121206/2436_1 /TAXON_ID=160619 /ORGANISM="Kryptoperidinium foliaceum, Strain CCMP 1326" /LENGTH=634 /DNA_ID=CAMNT_0017338605 /DNA_START=372 /DNA_END=2276 /DNA_ORIENTATION=-
MPAAEGGLGAALVGEKVTVGARHLNVTKLLGEGGFSYVYLVKENTEQDAGKSDADKDKQPPMVLKVTSIHSRAQRDIAEKEAKLLSRLSHPSIIKMYDTCYRQPNAAAQAKAKAGGPKERPQHLILMEFCEGGHALDVCNRLAANNQRFDLPTLIVAFGQICNAVSYLHAQRPPIVHRDLKPVNFLVKNGAYKLCDFGSAVFGHVDLRTPQARAEAEEVIQKTTTQMFRAPEMVDLYMAKKLTQATDVWALGCCLYSLAFLQNCFEEGSNLAILSGKYTIPEDNPYGQGLVELLDRMLTADSKARADMTEVILCLSAVYSGRPLPPRKRSGRSSKTESQEGEAKTETTTEKAKIDGRVGTYRTDGQGIQQPVYDPTKATEGKKLASNSVAARRKRAAAAHAPQPAPAAAAPAAPTKDPLAFSSFHDSVRAPTDSFAKDVSFGEMKGFDNKAGANEDEFFGSFNKTASASGHGSSDGFDPAFDAGAWGDAGGSAEETGVEVVLEKASSDDPPEAEAGRSDEAQKKHRKKRPETGMRSSRNTGTVAEAGMEALNINDEEDLSKSHRRHRSPKADDEMRRSGASAGSRGSRQAKPRSRKDTKEDTGESQEEKKPASQKGNSAKRGVFGRSKAAAPDP